MKKQHLCGDRSTSNLKFPSKESEHRILLLIKSSLALLGFSSTDTQQALSRE